MKKIIPVLALCVAVIADCIALVGLITVAMATVVHQVGFVATPIAIAGGVLSAVSAPLNFMFKRDRLCFIAFIMQTAAFTISVISITIWIVAVL